MNTAPTASWAARVAATVALALFATTPLAAQETDRQLLERIHAELSAHLAGGGEAPVVPPPATGGVTLTRYEATNANGDSHQAHGRTEPAGALLWPTVTVTGPDGQPIAGLPGTWEVIEGGGQVRVAIGNTNALGTGMAQWWLGSAGRQVVRATYGGTSIDYVAHVGSSTPPPAGPTPPPPAAGSGDTVPCRVLVIRRHPDTPTPVVEINGEQHTILGNTTITAPATGPLDIHWHLGQRPGNNNQGWGATTVRVELLLPGTPVEGINSYGAWHYPWPAHRNHQPGGTALWGQYRLRHGGSGGAPASAEFYRQRVDMTLAREPRPDHSPCVLGLIDYGQPLRTQGDG